MAEQDPATRGSRARELAREQARALEPTPGSAHHDRRYPARVPHDRTDRHNLRARRRTIGPWIAAVLTWVVVEVVVGGTLAVIVLINGGLGPGGRTTPNDEYYAWEGSPEQGRSGAVAVLVLVGLAATGAAVYAGVVTARERREVLEIDADRMREGVRGVTVPRELRPSHDWFGRRRRRALRDTPAPRAHPEHHHDLHPEHHHPEHHHLGDDDRTPPPR